MALTCGVRIVELAQCFCEVGFEINTTGEATGRVENTDFACGALDWTTVETSRRNATNNISQRTKMIHEDPESREGIRGLEDAMQFSTLEVPTVRICAHPLNIMVIENMKVATAPAV